MDVSVRWINLEVVGLDSTFARNTYLNAVTLLNGKHLTVLLCCCYGHHLDLLLVGELSRIDNTWVSTLELLRSCLITETSLEHDGFHCWRNKDQI